jgi:DNA-binding transcriptional LysR family regulator
MLDVHRLLMLRAVAAEGSIAAAARSLQYTRSAVSQQLSALESEAGAHLVDRTGNRIRLTRLGAALVAQTERILAELRTAEALLDRDAGQVSGLLRVGIPFREGPPVMSRALTGVRRGHPGLEIQLIATTDEAAADDVYHERLDLAILSRFGPPPRDVPPGLREWVLGTDPLRLYLPAGHPLASRTACALPELRDEAWVISRATTLGRMIMTLCAAAGFEPRIAALVDDLSTAIRLTGIGWGVTVAPELTPAEPESSVVRVPLEGVEAARQTILVVRDGEETAPRIAVAVEAVREVGRSRLSTVSGEARHHLGGEQFC